MSAACLPARWQRHFDNIFPSIVSKKTFSHNGLVGAVGRGRAATIRIIVNEGDVPCQGGSRHADIGDGTWSRKHKRCRGAGADPVRAGPVNLLGRICYEASILRGRKLMRSIGRSRRAHFDWVAVARASSSLPSKNVLDVAGKAARSNSDDR